MKQCYRILLLALLTYAVSGSICFAAEMNMGDEEADMPTEMPGYSTNALREMADRVQRTGVGFDKIPALQRPAFLSVSDAALSMDDEEIVFVVHYPDNLVRIYPQRILVWHEVINDILPDKQQPVQSHYNQARQTATEGEARTITYSPLTGSVVAFTSMAGKYPTTFGVTGMLLNGNSILYDRASHSLWSQLLGVSIEGPFRGKRVERFQVTWATWKGAKDRYGGLHPQFTGKAEVLSRGTGHRRPYGKDPYGSYAREGTYYDNNQLPFPVSHLDPRLAPKKRILGIEQDSAFGAVIVDAVKELRVLNFTLGITPLVAIYDQELDAVRIFNRVLPGREGALTFLIFEDKLIDEQTRTEWFPTGRSIQGALRERQLQEHLSVDSMWFAWASFYRGTQLFPAQQW